MRKQKYSHPGSRRQRAIARSKRWLLLGLAVGTVSTTLFICGQESRPNIAAKLLPPIKPSAELLQKYDLNHNGKIDPEEREALRRDLIAHLNLLRAKSRQSHGGNSNLTETAKEIGERQQARREQLQVLHAKALEKYDLNNNGVLDPEEREKMKQDRQAFLKKLQAKLLEKYDANKNGVLDPEERDAIRAAAAALRQQTLDKYDKNHDGKLDEEERAAAIADLQRNNNLKK